MQDTIAPRLLTVPQAAAYLNISGTLVRTLLRQGTLPGNIRLGDRVLVDKRALDLWIDEQQMPEQPPVDLADYIRQQEEATQ